MFSPEVIDPAPSTVQEISPFEALAPSTVMLPFEQMVALPPATAAGSSSICNV